MSLAVTPGPTAPYTLTGAFPGPERHRLEISDGLRTFEKGVRSTVSNTRILVGTADSLAVQVVDLQARPVGTIRWNARPHRFSDEDKAAHAERAAWSVASAVQQQRIRDAVNAMQSPEFQRRPRQNRTTGHVDRRRRGGERGDFHRHSSALTTARRHSRATRAFKGSAPSKRGVTQTPVLLTWSTCRSQRPARREQQARL